MANDTQRYRRHERFALVADTALQIGYEREREAARAVMLDGIAFIAGYRTPGALRIGAEVEALNRRVSEARKRALVGADPLNITKHSKGNLRRRLANDPVERVGLTQRTVPAITRLAGKNKLDARQSASAATYRDAYEKIHASLGGASDFSRPRGGGSPNFSPADAKLDASAKLKEARNLVGAKSVAVLEQIVCLGHSLPDTARLVCRYQVGESIKTRDVDFVGRLLRETLTELADIWHPDTYRTRTRGFRSERHEAGDADVAQAAVNIYISP